MRIAEGVDVKLGIFDIETPLGVFDIGIYDVESDKWIEFEISKYKNDLYSFVKFYCEKHFDFWVSYNGIGFDHQVIQYIVDKHQEWFDLSGEQIAEKIGEFGSRTIDDSRYDISPPYKEDDFPVNCIDLFRIHHFDNEARRTSLKWCAFMMNMDVEEMPIHHTTRNFTPKMIEELKGYRRNDVYVTLGLLYLTLGEIDNLKALIGKITGISTELEELVDYKGKNKIQDRIDVMKETGLNCLNWSDVKIGEEWNRKDYFLSQNIRDARDMFPKKVKQNFGRKFKEFFPKTMNFQTQHITGFVKTLGEESIKNKKQKFPVKVGNSTYTIAKGGIHSTETHRKILPVEGWKLTDIDVQSQYPKAFLKFKACPAHLDAILYSQVEEKVNRRVLLKDKASALKLAGNESGARPFTSVQEMLKLCLNGGLYGKLGQKGSFLEYPEGVLKICMGNQIEILMLIEMMEQKGFSVMSGNTDGILVMYPELKTKEFLETCALWESTVGNTDLGKLEHNNFTGFWQESINHYIGRKADGKVKKKGRFMTEFEMNKNKSKRIVAMALEQYFIHGKNPIEYITNHSNIFDFCIGKKAFGNLHYEEILDESKKTIHKKLIRYYVCNSGNVFMKRGTDQFGQPVNNHCEATDKDYFWMGQPLLKYFNKATSCKKFSEYDVNYSYYILETLKRIDAIQKTKMAQEYTNQFKTKQLKMF